MITIVCLQFGNKYHPNYVHKLYNSINRNTSVPFEFKTLSNHSSPIYPGQLPLKYKDESWYNKMQFFDLDYTSSSEQIFAFDLDTIITGNLDNILSYRGKFVALRDFYRKDGLGSGLMSWQPDTTKYIWEYYLHHTSKKHRLGDQGILEEATKKQVDRWQDLYPGEIVSYKVHCKKALPKEAKIVCFHGKPNPHEIKDKWAVHNWQ